MWSKNHHYHHHYPHHYHHHHHHHHHHRHHIIRPRTFNITMLKSSRGYINHLFGFKTPQFRSQITIYFIFQSQAPQPHPTPPKNTHTDTHTKNKNKEEKNKETEYKGKFPLNFPKKLFFSFGENIISRFYNIKKILMFTCYKYWPQNTTNLDTLWIWWDTPENSWWVRHSRIT